MFYSVAMTDQEQLFIKFDSMFVLRIVQQDNQLRVIVRHNQKRELFTTLVDAFLYLTRVQEEIKLESS